MKRRVKGSIFIGISVQLDSGGKVGWLVPGDVCDGWRDLKGFSGAAKGLGFEADRGSCWYWEHCKSELGRCCKQGLSPYFSERPWDLSQSVGTVMPSLLSPNLGWCGF